MSFIIDTYEARSPPAAAEYTHDRDRTFLTPASIDPTARNLYFIQDASTYHDATGPSGASGKIRAVVGGALLANGRPRWWRNRQGGMSIRDKALLRIEIWAEPKLLRPGMCALHTRGRRPAFAQCTR